jgi:hypothetical protein
VNTAAHEEITLYLPLLAEHLCVARQTRVSLELAAPQAAPSHRRSPSDGNTGSWRRHRGAAQSFIQNPQFSDTVLSSKIPSQKNKRKRKRRTDIYFKKNDSQSKKVKMHCGEPCRSGGKLTQRRRHQQSPTSTTIRYHAPRPRPPRPRAPPCEDPGPRPRRSGSAT